MTTYNKATLKTFFETGDVPTGNDYANFIDSYVNIVDTASQTMASPLVVPEIITPRVSAANANYTGTVSGVDLYLSQSLFARNANLTGNFVASAATFSGPATFSSTLSAASLNVAADVSAVSGSVYCSAVRASMGVYLGASIVSAAGTAQGTAAVLPSIINRGKGVVDGVTTGFAIPANRTGLVQYIINDTVSANLYPPTGGQINVLATNAPFPMTANILYTILHIAASAYSVR